MRRAAVRPTTAKHLDVGEKKQTFFSVEGKNPLAATDPEKMLLNIPHHALIRTGSIITDEEKSDKSPDGASRAGPDSASIHGIFVIRVSALFLFFLSWFTQSWRQEFRKLGV